LKTDRILLKLSGEALAGDKHQGFDEKTVLEVAKQVKKAVDLGKQVAVVIGGGNFWRGRTSENMDRVKADQIGMLATVMNCIYASEMFRSVDIKTRIMAPFVCVMSQNYFQKMLQLMLLKILKLFFSQAVQAIHIFQPIWLQY